MTDDIFDPIPVPFLGGYRCQFVYEEHPDDPDVRAAMARLLDPSSKLRDALEPHLVAYCNDVLANYPPEWRRPKVKLERPGDIWRYVKLGDFLGGHIVVKVGPFDGRLTNARASDQSVKDVAYVPFGIVRRRG